MQTKNATRLLSIAVLSAFVIAGCAARGVRIAELKNQAPFSTTASTTEPVKSPWSHGPADHPPGGTRVEVKGTVDELAVFGGRSIGVHLQEDSRRIKS